MLGLKGSSWHLKEINVNSFENRRMGVLGAGLMGHGIAQVFARAGWQVKIWDMDPQVLKSAPSRIRQNFQPFINLGMASPEEMKTCLNHITLCTGLDDFCEGLELVIEAVSERLEVKRKVFTQLEERVDAATILASNTSAISIGRIAKGARHPERILGTHFWNPPQVIPGVEVIKGPETSPEVLQEIYDLLIKTGKKPVKVLKDIPGFLGSRLQQALWREAMKLVEDGVASPEDIDELVRHTLGLRLAFLGPFQTADLAGLDLVLLVQEDLYPELDCSREPSALVRQKVAKAELGAKSGQGFYGWSSEEASRVIAIRDEVLLRISQQLPSNAKS